MELSTSEFVTVYTPESSLRNPVKLVSSMSSDLWISRDLAWRFAIRDVGAQYRQTALGLIWIFILPLVNTMVWLFLNQSGIIVTQKTELPYAVFVLTGAMLWSVFIEAASAPLQQAVAAKSMLAKINFPREALILSGIYQTAFNAAMKILVLLIVIAFFGIFPGWRIFLLPAAIVELILMGTLVGIMLAPIGVLYSDIAKSLPLIMQFLMYFTPAVFPAPIEGRAAEIIGLNPLTPVITVARNWLTGYPAEHLLHFGYVFLASAALLLVMWAVFRAAMPIVIERMGA